MNRDKSREIFEKALTLIPGCVNSPARAFGGVGEEAETFVLRETRTLGAVGIFGAQRVERDVAKGLGFTP